ncbi:hypothetical protein GQ43DRAFT_150011 [Delitschia confertaspora ATCC 74209]|uniref:Uncharacterized protein n=1 Tax=Delitschia confertaspora ATCC 74209 TaxID=1513339 RepID=A0A9P4MPU9_9PLEO|nr:hypothetical protein GQ43DRAFT_150011 [Delitschia confertaspora ATCC 74209]
MTTPLEIHPDFRSQPWCLKLIMDTSVQPMPWSFRPNSLLTSELPCSLFAETLNTPSTVRAGYAL